MFKNNYLPTAQYIFTIYDHIFQKGVLLKTLELLLHMFLVLLLLSC